MLIAQITDLHIGFELENPEELNTRRLRSVLDRLLTMQPAPDLVVASGDLVEHGDAASYERVKAMFALLPMPVLLAVGNHDRRAPFVAAFPDAPMSGGFVHYAYDDGPLRIVVLDTLEEGRHGGAFCPARAAWLEECLAGEPDKPTLIVLHHPPIDTGIDWMDTHPAAPWAERLEAVVRRHGQVIGLVCGHIHRVIAVPWAGTTLTVVSSTAPQVALDLRPIDADVPDGRAMIVCEPPAFALHRWTSAGLISHFATASDDHVMVHFDRAFQPMVEMLMAEQPAP